jgi:hypothetical protein
LIGPSGAVKRGKKIAKHDLFGISCPAGYNRDSNIAALKAK